MPTSASLTSIVTFPNSPYQAWLQVPTMAAYFTISGPIYVQGSTDGVIFSRIVFSETNSNVIGGNDFTIGSGTSNRMVPIQNFGFQYVRLETSAMTCTTPAQFKFVFAGS